MTIIYRKNGGLILIEYIVVILFFTIFLLFSNVFLSKYYSSSGKIDSSIRKYNIEKIADNIVEKIKYSDAIKVKNKSISIDDIEIVFEAQNLKVYSADKIKADNLFMCNDFVVQKTRDRLVLKFKINEKYTVSRVVSLK